MKCIAIDDEPVALAVISQFCNRIGDIDLSVCSDPVEGLAEVMSMHPDIVFLDIDMNGISGIDLARQLPVGTCLIFTTAYAEFALDGFELDAVDYLHKPFSFERFADAVRKACGLIRMRRIVDAVDRRDERIVVKVEYKNVNVRVAEITYVEAMDNYVKIHVADARRPVISQMNLKQLGMMLPSDQFIRVHKSYMVSIGKIIGFTKKCLTLADSGVEIPIGRSYVARFVSAMQKTRRSVSNSII